VGRPGEPDAPSRVEFVAGVFWQPDPKVPLPPQATTDPSEVRFHGPHDLALGANGSVYVADTFANRIWSFDPKQNTVRVVAGTGKKGFAGDGGPAVDAEFNQAYCSSLTPDGGANVGADLLSTQLMRPHGVCLDPQGRLVIADSDNDRIIAGEISAVKSR
jgi:sugar lactone lactonase YvrE